jgi:1-acyl-sn-glycerol-3-phosphate acyltransferase
MSLDIADKIKFFGIILIAAAFVLGFSLPLVLINSLFLCRIWLFLIGFLIFFSGFTVFGKNSKWRKDHGIENLPKDTALNVIIVESKQSNWLPVGLPFGDSSHRSTDGKSDISQDSL